MCRSMLALGCPVGAGRVRLRRGDEPQAEPAGQAADQPDQDADAKAAPPRGPVRLLRLGSFDAPTYLAAPRGDSRRFVVQRGGTIVVVKGGGQLDEPFLDISDNVSTDGEGGLLSMAFAPDYDSSGRFYVYYTDREGFLQIDQFRAPSTPTAPTPRAAAR